MQDRAEPTTRRWPAAVAYLGPGFLVSFFDRDHGDAFVRWHAAQGFVLFFAEALALAGIVVLDHTVGRVPLVGLAVMVLVQVAAAMIFLSLSVIGCVKAVAGEWWEIPWLGAYARQLPIDPDQGSRHTGA